MNLTREQIIETRNLMNAQPASKADVSNILHLDLDQLLDCAEGVIKKTQINYELSAREMRKVIERLIAAVAKLGTLGPDRKTLFEGSPSQSKECYRAWVELNDALAQAKTWARPFSPVWVGRKEASDYFDRVRNRDEKLKDPDAISDPVPASSPVDMSEAACIVCGELVELRYQPEHLRIKHGMPTGGFLFWMDARAHFSEKPSMLVADIRKQCDVSPHGHFVQDVDGKSIHYSDGQAVDLTREPHFFILLPATY